MNTTATIPYSYVSGLFCPECNKAYPMDGSASYATCCNQPLFTEYDLPQLEKNILAHEPYTMWRYHAMLPVIDKSCIVSLGEGWTPIHSLKKLRNQLGVHNLLLKDESVNPTGSFKARGISMAVSKAKEQGVTHCIIPTAGNAGGALSAYAAKAGMKATVVMPVHTAETLKEECRLYGAELILMDGLIDACGKKVKQLAAETGAFDLSTLKEPYRLEGKKTLGYELAEQLNWQLPDVIIYPTGGGTGLIGMWKAFQEMLQLGWIEGKLPRMVVVQSENCDPMIQLYEKGNIDSNFTASPSLAYGLAVPTPFAKNQIQAVISQSQGTAIAVSETDMQSGIKEIASTEGLLLSPEGSACYIALQKLLLKKWILPHQTILLFNTGSWFKYR